jgi:hypothetical protein
MIKKVEKIEEKSVTLNPKSIIKNYRTYRFLTTTWYILWVVPVFKKVEIL